MTGIYTGTPALRAPALTNPYDDKKASGSHGTRNPRDPLGA